MALGGVVAQVHDADAPSERPYEFWHDGLQTMRFEARRVDLGCIDISGHGGGMYCEEKAWGSASGTACPLPVDVALEVCADIINFHLNHSP